MSWRYILLKLYLRSRRHANFLSLLCQIAVFVVNHLQQDFVKEEFEDDTLATKSDNKDEENLHTCSKCDSSFKSLHSLSRHKNEVHVRTDLMYEMVDIKSEVEPMKMDVDDEQQVDFKEVKEDLLSDICSDDYDLSITPKDLTKHKKIKNKDEFECSKCDSKFLSLKALSEHKNSAHVAQKKAKEEKKECDECHKTFYNEHGLKEHIIAMHTKAYPLMCGQCGKGFLQKELNWRFKKHEQICDGKLRPPLVNMKNGRDCEKCSKNCKTTSQYKRHMKRHLKVKDFPCSDCKMVYADKRPLMNHVQLKHPSSMSQFDKEKDQVCDSCDGKFLTKTELEHHKVDTHGFSYFKYCEFCGKGFIKRDYWGRLRSHQKLCPGQ